MSRQHWLQEMIRQHKQGDPVGIYAVCSAHPYVIEAALERAREDESHVLIEATSNQVNQFGGYTGMKPKDFRDFVLSIAAQCGVDPTMVILGGDHLGPNPWQRENAADAMSKAADMVSEYILAGFTKIHLDASMYLGDDPGERSQPLDPKVVAERSATLCMAAEQAFTRLRQSRSDAEAPVYVIGSEVPVPGGVKGANEELRVTTVSDFRETVDVTRRAFYAQGLYEAWDRVVAVVVQPGVEFGDDLVHEYDCRAVEELAEALRHYPSLVFEGHSTDYQRPDLLRQMVEDGVAILKVGPGLTFAMREAIMLLSYMEEELLAGEAADRLSSVRQKVEEAMLTAPMHWQPYYHGSERDKQLARRYSLSDRSRYYWPVREVQVAVDRLVSNLRSINIPMTLVSQFMPNQYWRIREGALELDPEALIRDRIHDVLRDYSNAVGGSSNRVLRNV